MGGVAKAAGGVIGGIGNVLLGKNEQAPPPNITNMNSGDDQEARNMASILSKRGLTDVRAEYDRPVDIGINEQANVEMAGVRGTYNDRLMQLRQSIAQRGLQNSSLGLNQEANANQDMSTKIAAIRASIPGRIEEARQNRVRSLLPLTDAVANAYAPNYIATDNTKKRGVGLLDIAGKGASIIGNLKGGGQTTNSTAGGP